MYVKGKYIQTYLYIFMKKEMRIYNFNSNLVFFFTVFSPIHRASTATHRKRIRKNRKQKFRGVKNGWGALIII